MSTITSVLAALTIETATGFEWTNGNIWITTTPAEGESTVVFVLVEDKDEGNYGNDGVGTIIWDGLTT